MTNLNTKQCAARLWHMLKKTRQQKAYIRFDVSAFHSARRSFLSVLGRNKSLARLSVCLSLCLSLTGQLEKSLKTKVSLNFSGVTGVPILSTKGQRSKVRDSLG